MFTTLQFAQVVAGCWHGPAAARIAIIEHYSSAEGSYTTTSYRVSYHPESGQLGGVCYQRSAPCPFEAIAAALTDAQHGGALLASELAAGMGSLQYFQQAEQQANNG